MPVYIYLVKGTDKPEHTTYFFNSLREIDLTPQIIDLREQKVDTYSLPNLVQSMRVSRHSLVDEILATPLLSLDQVLPVGAHA